MFIVSAKLLITDLSKLKLAQHKHSWACSLAKKAKSQALSNACLTFVSFQDLFKVHSDLPIPFPLSKHYTGSLSWPLLSFDVFFLRIPWQNISTSYQRISTTCQHRILPYVNECCATMKLILQHSFTFRLGLCLSWRPVDKSHVKLGSHVMWSYEQGTRCT